MEHPYANPLAQITLRPLEGKSMGLPPGTTLETWTQRQLEPLAAQWVDLETSFQWASFQRAVQLLRGRGNRVFVVVGPFNEPMLTPAAAASYSKTLAGVDAWLTKAGVPHWIAPALPSDEYADASHPLAAGYARMAEQMLAAEGFKSFANAVAKEGQSK
jgi:hypothetical protein